MTSCMLAPTPLVVSQDHAPRYSYFKGDSSLSGSTLPITTFATNTTPYTIPGRFPLPIHAKPPPAPLPVTNPINASTTTNPPFKYGRYVSSGLVSQPKPLCNLLAWLFIIETRAVAPSLDTARSSACPPAAAAGTAVHASRKPRPVISGGRI